MNPNPAKREAPSTADLAAGLAVTAAVASSVISAPAEAQANEQAERATAATLETAPVEAPAVEATTPVETTASPEIEVAPALRRSLWLKLPPSLQLLSKRLPWLQNRLSKP
jgi:hypothetical protein